MSNLDRMKRAVADKPAPKAKVVAAEVKPQVAPSPVVAMPSPEAKMPKSKPVAVKTPTPRPQRSDQTVMRLPAGSRKELVWDGENWNGTLSVPGVPEPFWWEARSEVACFRGLHRAYEKWLKEQGKAVAAEANEST